MGRVRKRMAQHVSSDDALELERMQMLIDKQDAHLGDDKGERHAVWLLRIGTVVAVFCGSLAGSGIVWTLGDIGVGAMAWINLVAILLLSPGALRALRDYERQQREGKEPRFEPDALAIRGADFWAEAAAAPAPHPDWQQQ